MRLLRRTKKKRLRSYRIKGPAITSGRGVQYFERKPIYRVAAIAVMTANFPTSACFVQEMRSAFMVYRPLSVLETQRHGQMLDHFVAPRT